MEAFVRFTAATLIDDLEVLADEETGGVWTEPMGDEGIAYRIRDLVKYCEQHGKRSKDLTDEELKQFEMPYKGCGITLREQA